MIVSPQQVTVALCGLIIIAAICAVWFILAAHAALSKRSRGRHARLSDDRDESDDRDGTVTQLWLRGLHVAEQPELPAAGPLPMLPPDPPPDETRPQPVIKDVAACELGMPTTEYVDRLFAEAAARIGVLP